MDKTRVLQRTDEEIEKVLGALAQLGRGQRVVYHSGPTLEGCDPRIRETVSRLWNDEEAYLFQKRRRDAPKPLGSFDYIAIGR